ncbi:MAG: trypsin-like peptidase domain-containing protein [Myxococcales bacterium]
MFELVRYPAPLGENWAYVSPPVVGKRRPGLVYLAGGFDWGVGESAWLPALPENDQSGRAFHEAGIALMRPSLRGSHDNPGHNECFFGEVDDVLAAADFLAARPDVDPERIYVAGHSTGATLALLAVAASNRFRSAFAFGAIDHPDNYGPDACLPAHLDQRERDLRAPVKFIASVRTPTFAIEGEANPSNIGALKALGEHVGRAPVTFVSVSELTHFSVLAPASKVVARAIVADSGEQPRIEVRAQDILEQFKADRRGACARCIFARGGGAAPAWIKQPHQRWPQVLLTNVARFGGRSDLEGASAFLLATTERRPVLATAAHLTGASGGVEPPLRAVDLMAPALFDAALEVWFAFPRTREEEAVTAHALAEPAAHGDWLILQIEGAVPSTLEALPLAAETAKIGDTVYLPGCPYSEPTCTQNVYRGVVTGRRNDHIRYSLDPPVDVRGFSGAPILNAEGGVVGVFSVTDDLRRAADGRYTEGQADERLVRDVCQCAALK